METEQVEVIRELSRNTLQIARRRHKDEETDGRRFMGSLQKPSTNVVEIANKLKTKSSIPTAELRELKNKLYEDLSKIEAVLNVHGALRGLVRELTGNDVNNQCAAAGCLCNIALGDEKACMAVAKAAGAYLIAALDSLTVDLATTSAWTIGNLSFCQKVSSILVVQGAVTKLIEMMAAKEERTDAAVYALTRIVYSMGDQLSSEHHSKIVEAVSKIDVNKDSCMLLFYLSCSNEFQYTNEGTYKLITKLKSILDSGVNLELKCTELDYLLRILANINSEPIYSEMLNYFVEQNLVEKLKCLLNCDIMNIVLWFVGNMYNLCGGHCFFECFLSN